MARSELRIAEAAAPERSRWSLLLPALAAVAVGLAATWLGAGRVRGEAEPRELARAAVATALEHGSDDPRVVEALRRLRATLDRRPLDGETRVAYAGLLLHVGSDASERVVPAFHARVAARYAPVTVPVVRAAALTLARTGDTGEAARLVRAMFGYDAHRAARLLIQIEPWLTVDERSAALPDSPGAWASWLAQLRDVERHPETVAALEWARSRWPDNPELLLLATSDAVAREDWQTLERLLPPERRLPEQAPLAFLFLHRGRLRTIRGDAAGARDDITTALRLAPNRASLHLAAGDAMAALGDWTQARRVWRRFERETDPDDAARRRAVLLRLARLEQRHGEPAAALRLWRSIAELDPENEEARRAVRELTGLAP